jgi:hypothetical protein
MNYVKGNRRKEYADDRHNQKTAIPELGGL